MNKKIIFFFLLSFFLILSFFLYSKFLKKDEVSQIQMNTSEDSSENANIIKDVEYISKDIDGNEYIINASQGEIDYSNSSVIYLTDVVALINLNNSETIRIISDYGKYNIINFDTIFSKNVIVTYSDNKIKGEYLDFSIEKNLMIISRNVIYTNLKNYLKADVIEVKLDTKKTKIFMYKNNQKVKIKSKN